MTTSPANLVIGVTGHRKLADRRGLAAKIDAILDEIAGRTASDGAAVPRAAGEQAVPLRLVVLSPLAEGADRLVAQRVLARAGAELEAVLPMDERTYAADFEAEGSRAEFEDLLSKARSVRRLADSPSRAEAYAAAGRYVVDRCDVLIAVWDGRPEEGPGGTAEIVRYAREKGRALIRIDPGAIS